ncbi:hypothetical protein [Chryseobacterium sp.]|uniref:hypothetical protein n=1 Tax=Chryseobacterium sp. TaxID=1871047 RepID=UPI000ED96CE2|nr:hypothetical protein [Chryseobacterium sp.]HCA08771.1 hypothetical protein [Chryseobacterium sp.]
MESTYHYPFIRQIKDFYRYRAQGNIFLEVDVHFRKADLNKINTSIAKLHKKYSLLNCQFILKDDMLYFEDTAKNTDGYFKEIPESSPVKNPNDYFHPLRIINQSLDIHNVPLIYYHLYKNDEFIIFKIFAHHMLCDANGLQKIKNDFISFYNGAEVTEVYNFGEYAVKRNNKLFKSLEDNYRYWKNVLSEYDDSIISPIDFSLFNSQSYGEKVASLVHAFYYTPTDEYSRQGKSYHDSFFIDRFQEVQSAMQKIKVSWISIFMLAFSKTVYAYQGKSLIGLLVSGKNDVFSMNSIGEYSGECFYPAEDKALNYDHILATTNSFMTVSKHLIFNYALLNWDEQKFFRTVCKSFINLSIVDQFTCEEEKLKTFENIDLIFLELEPLFFMSKSDGLVYINWRFNTSKISEQTMKQIAEDFAENFRKCLNLCLKTQDRPELSVKF